MSQRPLPLDRGFGWVVSVKQSIGVRAWGMNRALSARSQVCLKEINEYSD